MQALFPTCRLARGTSLTHAYAEKGINIDEITFTASDGNTKTVQDMLSASFTDAFLVTHAGDIVSEQYFNNMAVDSHHLVNSVTKTFVGMLAGVAVEQNKLDPDALLTAYIPELATSAWEGATIRHLLDMTAGVNYQEDYTNATTDFWQEAAVVGWCPPLVHERTPQTLLGYAQTLQGQDQPNGSRFHYRTVTTNVLGLALERVMQAPLGQLLTENIWTNLCARNDANVVVDAHGGLYVGAGLSACARDLASFGIMINSDGTFLGKNIIPTRWIQDTVSGDTTSRQCYLDSEYAGLGLSHYRNQVWVKDIENGVLLALGIHGQIIYMNKAKQVVIVKLSSQPSHVDIDMFLEAFSAMDAIADAL